MARRNLVALMATRRHRSFGLGDEHGKETDSCLYDLRNCAASAKRNSSLARRTSGIDAADITSELRNLAQGLIVEGVDATYAMG